MNVVLRDDLRVLAIQWARELAGRNLSADAIDRFCALVRMEAVARTPIPATGNMSTAERSLRRRMKQRGIPLEDEQDECDSSKELERLA